MGQAVQRAARALGSALPRRGAIELFRRLVGSRHVALCLHRIHRRDRPTRHLAEMSLEQSEADELLALLGEARPLDERWLTVAFDDGYADAAAYVASRAPLLPDVQWRFFVCPQKTERREGFGWDAEALGRTPAELGDDPRVRLATVDECRALASLKNVRLGNHTNAHENHARLDADATAAGYLASRADFERLFGAEEELAVPFGTPMVELFDHNVRALREAGARRIWSTEPRAYSPAEDGPGAVLPRFAVDGTWRARETFVWMALRTELHRVRGGTVHFPLQWVVPDSQTLAA